MQSALGLLVLQAVLYVCRACRMWYRCTAQALDLKPNYMRAWTNMGISYANLGDYERSGRFYVRALGLNSGADHV